MFLNQKICFLICFYLFTFSHCSPSPASPPVEKEFLYLIGGNVGDTLEGNRFTNEVWRSSDRKNWELLHRGGSCNDSTKATLSECKSPSSWAFNASTFSPRKGHQVVSFKNKMYLIGGRGVSTTGVESILLNDVWTSSDGLSWSVVNTGGRCSRPNILHRPQCNDARETWTEGANTFIPREGHQSFVFRNNFYIIGGEEDTGVSNKIYTSSDGITWRSLESASRNVENYFSPRTNHSVVLLGNRIYLIGGKENGANVYLNDVWSSDDGEQWSLVNGGGTCSDATKMNRASCLAVMGAWTPELTTMFAPRRGHTTLSYRSSIFLMGGSVEDNGIDIPLNDVWSSRDGRTWNLVNPGGVCSNDPGNYRTFSTCRGIGGVWNFDPVSFNGEGRFFHKAAVNKGIMVISGGRYRGGISLPEVYVSTEGSGWTLVEAGGTCSNTARVTKNQCIGTASFWIPGASSKNFSSRHEHAMINFILP